ncbi:MAG TPA: glycoside hydrolase family 1 protein [Candidatus Andersenbacteria bacterium]|nr:glycoside hydrolase family 1 protein [Candidatus Andersenbacteria bacterium]
MNHRGFLYGASMSAHQVEGNCVNNNWWKYEQSRLPKFRSGIACDHWNRYKEDFALAHQLGHTAHRLSLEWSKIEPIEGKFDARAIQHYREVLLELKKYNIKTFVTLHHFTNPLWFEKRGGWQTYQAPEAFAKYVQYCAGHLGDLVDFWITINEPMVYVVQSYYKAIWPPQKKNVFTMLRVMNHFAHAHLRAYRVLRRITPHIPVGLAYSLVAYVPEYPDSVFDRLQTRIKNWFFNHRFFSLIKNKQDFIGVNYYFTNYSDKKDVVRSDMGWIISPEGLTQVLLGIKKYNKPIYITENGIADAHDVNRAEFITSHLRAIELAQKQGVDVRGYLYWSLLDNFEWAEGFEPRFGLIAIDYKTQTRTIRPSALVYKAIIEQAKRG